MENSLIAASIPRPRRDSLGQGSDKENNDPERDTLSAEPADPGPRLKLPLVHTSFHLRDKSNQAVPAPDTSTQPAQQASPAVTARSPLCPIKYHTIDPATLRAALSDERRSPAGSGHGRGEVARTLSPSSSFSSLTTLSRSSPSSLYASTFYQRRSAGSGTPGTFGMVSSPVTS
jgi:hypothetical protein